MVSRRFVATSALALALTHAAACGNLSGDTGSPSTLTTIHGTLTTDSTSPAPASLAAAIVWFQISADQTLHESVDSVPITGTFPTAFNIDIASPPPADVMIDLGAGPGDSAGEGVHYAFGYLAAYDDLNRNGRLDLVDTSASRYVDAIEAVADRLVFYLDRPIPAAFFATSADLPIGLDGSMPQPGYNLAHLEMNYCYAAVDGGAGGTCRSGVIWEPMTTPVTLAIGATPWMVPQAAQELMCSTGVSSSFSSSEVLVCSPGQPCPTTISVADFPGALPSPDDPALQCSAPDNFTYTSSCTTTVAGTCQNVDTQCTQLTFVTLDPVGGPHLAPPAGWPCPAQPVPAAAFLNSFAGQQTGSSGGGGGTLSGGATSPDAGTPAN